MLHPGVVDQDVDGAMVCFIAIDGGAGASVVSDVKRQLICPQSFCRARQFLSVSAVHYDTGACLDQTFGQSIPDPLT